MRLVDALRLTRNTRLALVGSGGKTTTLFQAAHQLEPPVLVTATTHLGHNQFDQADRSLIVHSIADVETLRGQVASGVSLLTGPVGVDERSAGLSEESLEAVHRLADEAKLPVLIEADGSRQKPVKAPAAHEPVIPAWANMVGVVVGLSGLGKPLTAEWAHRPEIISELTGLQPGELMTTQILASLLAHPRGGLKSIPPGARRAAILNQADTPELRAEAAEIASRLVGIYDTVLIAALGLAGKAGTPEKGVFEAHEPAAGIILAAGSASRMGQPKQLLEWHGEPFVRRVARTTLEGGLSPVVVVTGSAADAVSQAVADLSVQVVDNPEWAAGQSSSLQRGLRALPADTGSAIFLLADQPQVDARVVRALVSAHSQSLAAVIAPQIAGKRANPVLFDQATFADLLQLSGDVGGRAIFARYPVTWLPWDDPRLLLDVDTPEDYQRLLEWE